MATPRHALNHNISIFKKLIMIAIKINQIIGHWIRSTTERLIAANSAGIVKIDLPSPDRGARRSMRHVSGVATLNG
jgi:hypothetical protein